MFGNTLGRPDIVNDKPSFYTVMYNAIGEYKLMGKNPRFSIEEQCIGFVCHNLEKAGYKVDDTNIEMIKKEVKERLPARI